MEGRIDWDREKHPKNQSIMSHPKKDHTYRITDYEKLTDEQLMIESEKFDRKLDALRMEEFSLYNMTKLFGIILNTYNITVEMFNRFDITDDEVRRHIEKKKKFLDDVKFSLN